VSSGEALRRYLKVAERQPMQAILATDWRRRPPMLKRYPRRAAIALDSSDALSRVLSESYGLIRYRWDNLGLMPGVWYGGMLSPGRAHRPVPSAGGLYPSELYLVKPEAVFHYDPAAHALDPVRPGDFREAIGAPEAGFSLVLTSVFARTAFKYQEFGFRLQCLDAGVLTGQVLTALESAGLRGRMRLSFGDAAVAATLGIHPDTEAPLVIVDVGHSAPAATAAPGPHAAVQTTAGPHAAAQSAAARAVPPAARLEPAAQPSARTRPVSVLDSLPLTRELHHLARKRSEVTWPAVTEPVLPDPLAVIALPGPEFPALSRATARRKSFEGRFGTDPVALTDLAAVLAAAYRGAPLEHLLPLCAVHRVEGLEPGLYRYRPAEHELLLLRRENLRSAMAPSDPGNARLLGDHGGGAVLVPLGDYERGLPVAGERWFQMQNVPAGISIQRATLAGAALGLGCRVVCAFDVGHLAGVLGLDGGPLRPLCQVLIGSTGTDVGYDQPL
jgi:SagB-type dehydrogenase family enzyme